MEQRTHSRGGAHLILFTLHNHELPSTINLGRVNFGGCDFQTLYLKKIGFSHNKFGKHKRSPVTQELSMVRNHTSTWMFHTNA